MRGGNTFFPVIFPFDFFVSFFRPFLVSLHEKFKNTMKIFSKIKPENLKNPQKN
jgi:hypothetical protein